MTNPTIQENDYTLGSGELWFAKFVPGTKTPAGYRYIGNTPDLSFATTLTNLDHVDSDHGHPKFKDRTVPLTVVETISVSCDNIDWDNLALLTFGTKATITTAAATIAAEHIDNVSPGLFYQLGQSDSNPPGARGLTTVSTGINATVTDDTPTTPIAFTQGTDFIIDLDRGTLYVVPGGAIDDGDNLRVTYKTAAVSHTRVISGQTPIEGAVKFTSFNTEGTQKDYFFPYVQVIPDGDFPLKGDVWQLLKFKMETLKIVGKGSIYVDGAVFV